MRSSRSRAISARPSSASRSGEAVTARTTRGGAS